MATVSLYIWIASSYCLINLVAGQGGCTRMIKPVFIPTETELRANEGTSLTLPCVFNNMTSDFQIYWYAGVENIFWNGNPQTGSNNYRIDYSPTNPIRSANLTIKILSRYDSLRYECRASARGCKIQPEFNVVVNYRPTVQFIEPREPPFWDSDKPGKIFVNETDNITLGCNTSSEPVPLVSWVRITPAGRQVELSPATDETKHGNLIITNVSRIHSGIYRCQATNGLGFDTGDVELVVQYAPEVIGLQTDIRAAPGTSVTFGCDVIAQPERVVFYWMKDGVKLTEYGTDIPNTFVILKLDPTTDYGNYTCVASNQVGSVSATLEVNGRPGAPVILNKDPQGSYRHSYNLTWSPVSSREENSSQVLNIPIARYVIKYQRKDIQNIKGSRVTVLWPNEALSETVHGRQLYIILRDLKENSSYVGRVCPESDYGMGDCVSYTFTTSAVDYQPPPSPEIGYSGKCSNPGMCVGTWTPPAASTEKHSAVAMVTFTVCFIALALTL